MHSDDELETTDGTGEMESAEAPVELEAPPEDAPIEGESPRLVVKRSGAETEIVFPLNPPSTIGRFDPDVGPIDVDLGTLDEGVYVSRKHAQIVFEEDVWKIRDLGSSNGTFVLRGANFERVEESDLADGDEIALGNARFVFRM